MLDKYKLCNYIHVHISVFLLLLLLFVKRVDLKNQTSFKQQEAKNYNNHNIFQLI